MRVPEGLHEFVAHSDGKHWIVQIDLRQTGNGAEHHVLDAGKAGVRDGDRIAVAAQSSGETVLAGAYVGSAFADQFAASSGLDVTITASGKAAATSRRVTRR